MHCFVLWVSRAHSRLSPVSPFKNLQSQFGNTKQRKKNEIPKKNSAFDPWEENLFFLSFFFLFRAAFSHAVRALYQDSLFALVLQQKIRFYEHIEVAGSITPAKHPN